MPGQYQIWRPNKAPPGGGPRHRRGQTSGVAEWISAALTEANQQAKEVNNPVAAKINTSPAATGKNYILFEGTVLESVLINRLDGHFSGPIECLLTNDIYSHDRQHLLIPAGSKVLGETKKVDAFGQARLAVLFHRLIMPDGYSLTNTTREKDESRTVDRKWYALEGTSVPSNKAR